MVAALAVTAVGASQTPIAAHAQSSAGLGVALETAASTWTTPVNARLAFRVSVTNRDSQEAVSPLVTLGVPRDLIELSIAAPKAWLCGYDEVPEYTVTVVCSTNALRAGETAQIYVNGKAPRAGGKYSIWTSARPGNGGPELSPDGGLTSVTSSEVLTVLSPPTPPAPRATPTRPSNSCPQNVCI